MTSMLAVAVLALTTGAMEEPHDGARARRPVERKLLEISVGDGPNSTYATLGFRLTLRPIERWSIGATVGLAPASTNPDLACAVVFLYFPFLYGLSSQCETVRHVGGTPWRLSMTTAYNQPIARRLDVVVTASVVRNPGAIRSRQRDLPSCSPDCPVVERLVPTTYLASAGVGLALYAGDHVVLRLEGGVNLPVSEDLSPAQGRAIDRSLLPDWWYAALSVGAQFL